MKCKLTFILILLTAFGYTQTPELINYQAVMRDSVGQILSNQQIDFQLSILKGNTTGLTVYKESHEVLTNDFGQITIQIGGGIPTVGDFSSIDWGVDEYYIETAIDSDGQGNFLVMGTSQLVSVPYALNSKRTESLILTDQFGTQYELWVDSLGNIGTYPVYQNGEPCPGMPYLEYHGQKYYTIKVGNQCWLRENLNVGTMINGTTNMQDNDTIEKYCYENIAENCETYGGLYEWNELMKYSNTVGIQGICPIGWHIPSNPEFNILTAFLGGDTTAGGLGGDSIAGGKLKTIGTIEEGTGLWHAPNLGATNESGFSVLPSGNRRLDYLFEHQGNRGYFWTSSEVDTDYALYRRLNYYNKANEYNENYKVIGFSIRCIRNQTLNQQPNEPNSPNPLDGTTMAPINSTLNWSCSDPENDPLNYDVYFGTTNPPTLMNSGQAETSFDPGILAYSETYYWKIVAHDEFSATEAPVWSFSSEDPPTEGLVAYYPFNGNANDESGNGNNGSMINNPNFENGINDQAINLNGIDQYVRVPNSISLNPSQISISTWIKLNSIPASHAAVIQKYNDEGDDDVIWQIIFGNNGDGEIYQSVVIDNIAYSDPFNELMVINTWIHLAITFDGNSIKSYFNGALQSTIPAVGNVNSSLFDISIGRGKPINDRWIDGLIDEMRVYSRALSEPEIQAFYKN